MLSSLNSYGGLSTANILMLFGASASSSSNSTSSSGAPSSSPTGSASAANDPVATIKAILAQSQIGGGAGSANVETVVAAYAAQSADSNVVTGAAATISSPGDATAVSNGEIESGSSLVVATANGLESVTTGSNTQIANLMQNGALAQYSNDLATEQISLSLNELPPSAARPTLTLTPVGTSASGASPQAEQSVLLLRMTVVGGGLPLGPDAASNLDTLVGALTQQLVSSFEDGTLSSTSTPATGFSYAGADGGAEIIITGIEASVSESAPITDTIRQSDGLAMPDFMTTLAAGGYDFFSGDASNGDSKLGVIMPLGNS